ncbi:MAG: DinB family protein [Candidatus Methanofastidiosia archaeon]|jgi:uncharacterized damage-inducible protein DinB
MRFPVAIEQGTIWYGRFINFPGTIARAPTKKILMKELRKELVYHISWLKKHHEKTPDFNTIEIHITEEIHNIKQLGESGGEVAFFSYDTQPITKNRLPSFIRLMNYNRDDLLHVVTSLPKKTLTWIPPEKSRTIINILHHVCNAEEFYISRFGFKASKKYEKYAKLKQKDIDNLPILERLTTVRNACIKTLQDVVFDTNTIFTHSKYTKYPDEKWSSHKVLRRFLEHEREHLYNILEYIDLKLKNDINKK